MNQYITKAIVKKLRNVLILKGMCTDNKPSINLTKTPPVYTNGYSFAVVMCLDELDKQLLDSLDGLEVIGECINNEYVFNSEEARTDYELLLGVGDYANPDVDIPYKVGVFA